MKQSLQIILIFISLTGIQFSWAEEKNESEQTNQLEPVMLGDGYTAPCLPYPDCGNSDETSTQAAQTKWLKWLESLKENMKDNSDESEKKQ